MKQKISVRALVKIDDKVLLLRRSSGNLKYIGQLELPGGKVEFGESPESALRREVTEETGQEISALQLFKLVSWMDTVERDTQHIIIVYLVGLANGARIILSEEHDKFVWEKLSTVQLEKLNVLSKKVLMDELEEPASEETTSEDHVDVVIDTSDFHNVVIYTDGGSRGNPGPSASGFVILTKDNELLFEGGKYLGITTNNQAEYHAVKLGLEKARELGARTIDLRLDSQLVANQLTGVYQIKNRDLWPIYASIKELITKFHTVTFTHVRREFNKDADAMVNKILDQHQ